MQQCLMHSHRKPHNLDHYMLDKQTQPFFKITEFFRNLPRNCSSLKINKTQQYQQNMIHTKRILSRTAGQLFRIPCNLTLLTRFIL